MGGAQCVLMSTRMSSGMRDTSVPRVAPWSMLKVTSMLQKISIASADALAACHEIHTKYNRRCPRPASRSLIRAILKSLPEFC